MDLASKGRTTIVVSHRLSAIKSADRIFFLDQGKVVEEGSHNDLMKMKGMYYHMVHAGDLQTVDANDQDVEEKSKLLQHFVQNIITSSIFQINLLEFMKSPSNLMPIIWIRIKKML